MRLNDSTGKKMEVVDSISTYLDNIKKLEEHWCSDGEFMVYRGETEEYSTPCIPTIYRGNLLKKRKNYEKNMFMAMRQNNISSSEDFLHNAIDAQHDGFPSRLLDVSYNSLIALYFAVTPYYSKNENDSDSKDGVVYVFKYCEAYSPEAQNTKKLYADTLSGSDEFVNFPLVSLRHVLIDHCKQNKRIIAQQGAFILFTGEVPDPIPYNQMYGIRIPGEAKESIRHDLKIMFGIYTGSVYPEVELMQEEIKEMSLRINTDDISLGQFTQASLDSIRDEYDYFVECCDYYVSEKRETGELVRLIEKNVAYHKDNLRAYYVKLRDYYSKKYSSDENKDAVSQKEMSGVINKYNYILKEFISDLPECITNSIDNEIKAQVGEINNE